MSLITPANRLDVVNIGLLIVSCILAFIMPFELFLFAYGVLGPLHYLTEISWLHDKNYFSTDRRDAVLLVVISLVLTILSLKSYIGLDFLEVDNKYINRMIFVAFGSSLFFAFIRNRMYKLIGVALVILLSAVSDHLVLVFSVFLPTLVHVFIFTSLFMLFGALKTRSKAGYLSVAIHWLVPFVLFFLFSGREFVPITSYGLEAYQQFHTLNQVILQLMNSAEGDIVNQIYHSPTGLAIMRFIGFAYTYHYLNWFSKTKVIRWHQIPKMRSLFIVVLWAISVGLYAIDYALGFKWLFLLSFMHVMLEFPLNYISFVGIFRELSGRGTRHSVQ
ncbi:MAG TPA: hypothetical protein PLP34_07655 [Chitinophagaceae bacterium]|nr:hypothetical protein [Chitinophagaceae bacterium]